MKRVARKAGEWQLDVSWADLVADDWEAYGYGGDVGPDEDRSDDAMLRFSLMEMR